MKKAVVLGAGGFIGGHLVKYLKNKGYAKKILILDLDVHQGNGNSEIFQKDKDVLTFSMHCGSNYPAKKSKSDIDIELAENMEDQDITNSHDFLSIF